MTKKIFTFLLIALTFSACVNKNGISAKYYSECKEYYDFQGYYHKECGKDEIVTYQEMGDFFKVEEPEPPKDNVW